jgi:transcriptional regulator with XRE-family HTH domain
VSTARTYPDLVTFFRENPDVQARDIAKEVGCSMSFISMIKTGERQPNLRLALRIARVCRVPLESLVRQEPKFAGSRS